VSRGSFDFSDVSRVSAGAVGPPGKRTFYLQVRQGAELVTLTMEKEQLRVLAERLEAVMRDRPTARPQQGAMALEEPLDPAWRVGAVTVTYDPASRRFEVSIVELVEEGEEPATGHFVASAAQMWDLARHSAELVAAGRPPCPLCGGPSDHDGRVCPRLNGHRR
jgi:uncharacterized repeat protein (TIGR03847 family)